MSINVLPFPWQQQPKLRQTRKRERKTLELETCLIELILLSYLKQTIIVGGSKHSDVLNNNRTGQRLFKVTYVHVSNDELIMCERLEVLFLKKKQSGLDDISLSTVTG